MGGGGGWGGASASKRMWDMGVPLWRCVRVCVCEGGSACARKYKSRCSLVGPAGSPRAICLGRGRERPRCCGKAKPKGAAQPAGAAP